MTQKLLFDVAITGKKANKRKSPDLVINRINRVVAKDRYYYHKCLDADNFTVDGTHRIITTTYQSFLEIPIGQRYYINQLLKMQYNVQYQLAII